MQVLIEYFFALLVQAPPVAPSIGSQLHVYKFFNYFPSWWKEQCWKGMKIISIVAFEAQRKREGKSSLRTEKLAETKLKNVISNMACNSLIYFPHTVTSFVAGCAGRQGRKAKFLMQSSVRVKFTGKRHNFHISSEN